MTSSLPFCRIFGIHATKAPICVLLRRGPSSWVQLILWNTKTNTFQNGSWFKGRIYEKRCDLSPQGNYFVYFASKFDKRTLNPDNTYTYAWTAVSRPPSLSALLLWPKGDTWHGGGLFLDEQNLWLNHKLEQAILHPSHQHNGFHTTPNPDAYGEDIPIYEKRLLQKGWYTALPLTGESVVWERKLPDHGTLRYSLKKGKAKSIRHIEEFSLISRQGTVFILKGSSWVDLDLSGKILFSREGCVYRASLVKDELVETQVINLNPHQPPKEQSHDHYL